MKIAEIRINAMPSTPQFHTLVTALQLGALLKSARKQSKLTQTNVAVRLGLSQNRISYLEQHPDELSFKQLLTWCAVVGLELQLGERVDLPQTTEW
jgi:HTH-type transcriptional regulator/antitoxin HipB